MLEKDSLKSEGVDGLKLKSDLYLMLDTGSYVVLFLFPRLRLQMLKESLPYRRLRPRLNGTSSAIKNNLKYLQ